jgi:hypothetical protein
VTGAILGLVGVVVGAFLAWFRETRAQHRARRSHARYLAVRVVCVLDSYVDNCARAVLDDGLRDGKRDEKGCLQPEVSLPPPPVFSDDLDWKSIDDDLMYRLLSFPNEAEKVNRVVTIAWNCSRPPDFEEGSEEQRSRYAELGLEAFAISEDLRRRYAIPVRERDEWHCPIEYLNRAKEQVEEARRNRLRRLTESPRPA